MPEKPPAADVRNDIESVLHEDRKFECPEDFRQKAHIKSLEEYERIYRESVEQPGKILGRNRQRASLVQEMGQGFGVESSLGQMVRRRPAQSLLQLPRPPRSDAFARTKPQSSGKANPAKYALLLISNCIARCKSSPMS